MDSSQQGEQYIFYQHAMVYVVVSSVSELKQGKATISNLGYDNTVVSDNTPNGAMNGHGSNIVKAWCVVKM